MEESLKVLNELEAKGLIERYALAGAVGTFFYAEPTLTYDLDVFVFLPKGRSELILLSPLYDYLKSKGCLPRKEHILIGGVPVQLIPAYNPLVEEALREAKTVRFKRVKTRVLRPEHLLAIMLQTGRAKDKARIALFLEEAKINQNRLVRILKRHGLETRWREARGSQRHAYGR